MFGEPPLPAVALPDGAAAPAPSLEGAPLMPAGGA